MKYLLARFHRVLASLGYILTYASVSLSEPYVTEGEVGEAYKAMDTAVMVSVIIGIVIVAIGFVLGAIKYMKDDMQGGKDVIVKCLVAAAIIVLAPTITRFIVGIFELDLNEIRSGT